MHFMKEIVQEKKTAAVTTLLAKAKWPGWMGSWALASV